MPVSSQETPLGHVGGTMHPERTTRHTPASRRYTPYRKTPATRQLHSEARINIPVERRQGNKQLAKLEKESKEQIVGMLGKTWKVHKISPLFNFCYSQKELKSYARMLAAYITAETKRGIAVNPDEIPNKATFSVLKGIKQSDNDREAVRIVLKTVDQGEEKELLVAILCSADLKAEYINRSELHGFTTLPLLLVKGNAAITQHLLAWLQMKFDCKVTKLGLSSVSLIWMLVMWSGFKIEGTRSRKPIRLVYTVPAEVKSLSRIFFDIDSSDCHRLWESIHSVDDNSRDDFCEEEVVSFIKSLEEHFYRHMKIKLCKMHLSQFATPVVSMDVQGRLKMYSLAHCAQILAYLTQTCAEKVLNIP